MLEQEGIVVIVQLDLDLQMRKPEVELRRLCLRFLTNLDASYNESQDLN